MTKIPLKMGKICHISIRNFVSTGFTKMRDNFCMKFMHEIFRINIQPNLYLILLQGFLILISRKFGRQIQKKIRETFGIC